MEANKVELVLRDNEVRLADAHQGGCRRHAAIATCCLNGRRLRGQYALAQSVDG